MFSKKFLEIGKTVFFVALSVVVFSCKQKTGEEHESSSDSTINLSQVENAEKVFYSMPSPIETAVLLKKAGASYDSEYLNPVENKDKYATVSSKALNMGVYGSDLSYTTIFDKTQEAMLYLACSKKLADGLGISGVFSDDVISRMETNMGNKDSLLTIISDSYWEADAYLKENDRASVSAMLIAGGWIEGLYIATRVEESLRKSKKNELIIERIAEQKLSLENLISLVDSYKNDEILINLSSQLKDLKLDFDKVSATGGETSVAESKNGVATIGGDNTFTLSAETLASISKKIKAIRKGIVE
jgi:hypothetical protein